MNTLEWLVIVFLAAYCGWIYRGMATGNCPKCCEPYDADPMKPFTKK